MKHKPKLNSRGEVVYEQPTAQKTGRKIRFGVPGLDDLFEDGISEGHTILVAGSAGSGKTILCMQSLVYGAENGEPGVYLSFEQKPEEIREQAKQFGWDFGKLEKEKKLVIIFKDPYEVKDFSKTLTGELYYTFQDMKAKRIVIDSITYFGMSLKDKYKIRRGLNEMSRRMKNMGLLTLMVSEVPSGEHEHQLGRFGVEEFISDGVIHLHNFLIGDARQRAVEVLKMRNTKHDTALHPFAITKKGITIYPDEKVFK